MTRAKTVKTAVLTDQQRLFAAEYVVDNNATKAAVRAGYSEKTARQQGSRLLSNVDIQDEISTLAEAKAKRLEYDADQLLTTLLGEMNADIAELYDKDTNCVKPVHDWPMKFRLGVVHSCTTKEIWEKVEQEDGTKITEKIGEVVSVKLIDRLKLKEVIGRHIGVNAFREGKQDMGEEDPALKLLSFLTQRAIAPKG